MVMCCEVACCIEDEQPAHDPQTPFSKRRQRAPDTAHAHEHQQTEKHQHNDAQQRSHGAFLLALQAPAPNHFRRDDTGDCGELKDDRGGE
jgi:hypothetical protein